VINAHDAVKNRQIDKLTMRAITQVKQLAYEVKKIKKTTNNKGTPM